MGFVSGVKKIPSETTRGRLRFVTSQTPYVDSSGRLSDSYTRFASVGNPYDPEIPEDPEIPYDPETSDQGSVMVLRPGPYFDSSSAMLAFYAFLVDPEALP